MKQREKDTFPCLSRIAMPRLILLIGEIMDNGQSISLAD